MPLFIIIVIKTLFSGYGTHLPPMWLEFNISGLVAICGLSLLLVLYSAPRGFSPGSRLVVPSPQQPESLNSNQIRCRTPPENHFQVSGASWVNLNPNSSYIQMAVSEHFLSSNQSHNHMLLIPIKKLINQLDSFRKAWEAHLIEKAQTTETLGINKCDR